MVSRAQASIEFLMVTGIAMTLLVGATFFLFDFTQSSNDSNSLQQAAQLGYRIVDDAANMYVFGSGSLTTVSGSNPNSIQSIYTVDNDTLIIEIQTRNGVVPVQVFSTVPINGTQPQGPRTLVNPVGTIVGGGPVQYRVTSMGGWVEIRQI